MLGKVPQYRSTIRNYVIAFGEIFNDITVERKDSQGNTEKFIKVPLAYGPTQKFLSRLNIYNKEAEVAIVLPRMSFEISGITYDPSRKRNKLTGVKKLSDDPNKQDFIYNPVPYDIDFTLSIMVKNAEDGTQILEQILPFFTPSFNIPIKEVKEFDIVNDTPLTLTGVDLQDDYEGDYLTRRALIWTLSFTLKGNIWGSTDPKDVIRTAFTNIAELPVNESTEISTTTVPDDFGFGVDLD